MPLVWLLPTDETDLNMKIAQHTKGISTVSQFSALFSLPLFLCLFVLFVCRTPPPLDLSFSSFLTFFAPWYRKSREASSVKIA